MLAGSVTSRCDGYGSESDAIWTCCQAVLSRRPDDIVPEAERRIACMMERLPRNAVANICVASALSEWTHGDTIRGCGTPRELKGVNQWPSRYVYIISTCATSVWKYKTAISEICLK